MTRIAVGWAKARAKYSALSTRRFAAPCPRVKLHRGIPLGQSRRLGKRTAIRVGTARAIKPAQPACTHRRAPLPTLRESGGEVALPAAAEHLDVEVADLLAQGVAVETEQIGGADLVAAGRRERHREERMLDLAQHPVIEAGRRHFVAE